MNISEPGRVSPRSRGGQPIYNKVSYATNYNEFDRRKFFVQTEISMFYSTWDSQNRSVNFIIKRWGGEIKGLGRGLA